MYSGAQEEVRIQIFHRILYPPAGRQTIVLKVSAPESYPGEELIIRQGIYVTPVFKQALELFDDVRAAAELRKQTEVKPVSVLQPAPGALSELGETQPGADKQADSTPKIPPLVVSMESSTPDPSAQQKPPDLFTQEQAAPVAPQPAPATPRLKVVRAPLDDEDLTQTPAALPPKIPLEVSELDCPEQPPDDSAQKPAMPDASRPVPDVSKLKVVRDRSDSDSFWDEK